VADRSDLEDTIAILERAQQIAHVGSWVAEFGQSDHVRWSNETHRIFGVAPGQFIGTRAAFYEFVHPDDREAVRTASRAATESGQRYDIEHRIVRTDGAVRWVHELADVVRDADGRAIRMIGTVQDVTDRRNLEDQLRQSQKMEAIGRLAGGIAHDLNNTLTAIAGYAELTLNAVPPDHEARPDVEEIRRATERAAAVTRQLLAFSRKQILEPRIFDVNDTVASIARLLSRLVGPDIRVRTILTQELPPILGDPGQVEQAIVNLAVNARDAMPKGGELTIASELSDVDETFARAHVPMPPGRYVMLRVSDTGHGISREMQARIFEPFFTTKGAGKGTGLGLSMVYGTLKQIGGFIFVDSEIDRGTTFRLYFPPAPKAAAPAKPPAQEPISPGQETLLVVEDEDSVRNLVASSLRNDKYTVLLATSAEEALKIAESYSGAIDLLLTDAIMPGKSGVDLAKALLERWPQLPVIFMSGYTEEDLHVTALNRPIELLQKPFTPRELRRRIRSVLDR
jgi:PAS domain S-box-containing protein